MSLTQPRISSVAPCERYKCLRRASMPLALLMLTCLLPRVAQRLARLESAEQIQRFASLAGCALMLVVAESGVTRRA